MIKFVSGGIVQTTAQYLAQGVAVGSQEGFENSDQMSGHTRTI